MKTAFLHANLIDVMEGKMIPNCTVLVEDGIIADILMDDSHPNDASVIDLEGRYLTPGFFDCHVHIVNDSLPEALSPKKTAVGYTLTALENLERKAVDGFG